MFRGGNRQQSLLPQLPVLDQRLIFACHHHLFCRGFEANGPIVGVPDVRPPRIRGKIVNQVAAPHNQNAFRAQRGELPADLKMEGRRPGLVDTELHYRDISRGIGMPEH